MYAQQFYWADPRSALRGGAFSPDWLKNSGKAGVGQWRNGLRDWGIERGRAGEKRARDRLYADFAAPRNADLAKWAARGAFGG